MATATPESENIVSPVSPVSWPDILMPIMDQNFIDLSKSPSIGQQSTLPTPEPAAPGPRVNYNSAVTPLFASAEFGGLNPAVSPSASILKSPPSPTSSASLGAGSGGLLSKFKLRLLRSPKRNGGIVNPKSPLLTSPTSAANARLRTSSLTRAFR